MKRCKTLDTGMLTLCVLSGLAVSGCGKKGPNPQAAIRQVPPVLASLTGGATRPPPPGGLRPVGPPPPVRASDVPPTEGAEVTGPPADPVEDGVPSEDSTGEPPEESAGEPSEGSTEQPAEDSADQTALASAGEPTTDRGASPPTRQEFLEDAGLPSFQELGALTVPQLRELLGLIEGLEDDPRSWEKYGRENVESYVRRVRMELHDARMAGDRYGD